ncbi:MAG: hypothetical protein QF858_02740 [Candidatus Pacebacteria bacterium]|jgi:hypothetical protein|nr:hypothetical protein [bacterium]MDP6527771.1 hypothetical protein [Candidatus Paceibacterota bacterium]MDP6659608.1 hypothetical protein [Candidatus Paceibacterota bacterium]|tara:strand:+ start:243 stop:464 length:222 start_codon:yes stop_codon:yes gene_type:complete
MDLLFWGLTLGVLGKVLLGFTVLSVHWKIVKEHKIGKVVLREIRRERNLAILGILFIVVGYLLELSFYEYIAL